MTGKPAFNHDALKQLSEGTGRPVSTLIALASRNDPFFIGVPGQTDGPQSQIRITTTRSFAARCGRRRRRATGEDHERTRTMTNASDQHRMIAGVRLPIFNNGLVDYDELLREAIRVALRIGTDPVWDDFPDLSDRYRELIDAYIRNPEGLGDDDDVTDSLRANTSMLMCRLVACIADIIPLEKRRWAAN